MVLLQILLVRGKVQMEVGISSGSTPGCIAGVSGRLFEGQGLLNSQLSEQTGLLT